MILAVGKGSLPEGVPANASALLQAAAQQFVPIILAAEQSEARIQTNGIEVGAAAAVLRCCTAIGCCFDAKSVPPEGD